MIKKYCILKDAAYKLLELTITDPGLSTKTYDKVLKVTETITNLAASETILAKYASKATKYGNLAR